jgi:hypothetical protein
MFFGFRCWTLGRLQISSNIYSLGDIGVRFLFTAIFIIGLYAGCNHSGLPTIKNAEALRSGCLDLFYLDGPDNILANRWPQAVNALHPISVVRSPDHIEILIKRKSGVEACGYWVCRDPDVEPESRVYRLTKTNHEGIYQFELFP